MIGGFSRRRMLFGSFLPVPPAATDAMPAHVPFTSSLPLMSSAQEYDIVAAMESIAPGVKDVAIYQKNHERLVTAHLHNGNTLQIFTDTSRKENNTEAALYGPKAEQLWTAYKRYGKWLGSDYRGRTPAALQQRTADKIGDIAQRVNTLLDQHSGSIMADAHKHSSYTMQV